MDLKEMAILNGDPSTHWYYRSKARAMLAMLGRCSPNCVLDVGAGSGFFSRYLLEHTNATEAWCLDTGYAEDWDAVQSGKPVRYRREISNSPADLVLMMDVLEHVDDDRALLSGCADKVRRGGNVLISVPAFQWLWSEHDEFLEHRRRYSLERLEQLVESSGLKVLASAYYFGFVLPIAAAGRLPSLLWDRAHRRPRSQLVRHSPLVNQVLSRICAAEIPMMRANRLGGLTAFCLASIG
jgi:SAM-dependent methyltransferase